MTRDEMRNLFFYEIYPVSFFDSNNDGIGDLNGITEKLEYIKNLGPNALWINPFFLSPFRDGGYDVKDFYAIDPRFGTFEDFSRLLEKAHKLGFKVIIDLIPGHASDEHPDFIASGEPIRNDKWDLFIWNEHVWQDHQGYRMLSGCYQRNASFMVNFFAFQPAFNYGFNKTTDSRWQMSYEDPRTFQARDYMVNVMKFWLGKGVDGFRVDMADSLVKNDDDKEATIKVWNYMFDKVKQEYPDAFFVSEWCNPDRAFRAGFDCDFVLEGHNTWYNRLLRGNENEHGATILNGGDFNFYVNDLRSRVEEAKKHNAYLGIISGNHDTWRFANYRNEHDTKFCYMMAFINPGIPFLYMGDEILMKQANIPSKDGGFHRTGNRTPIQWDKSKNAGFSKADEIYLPVFLASDANIKDQLEDKSSFYYWLKGFFDLRMYDEDLLSNDFEIKEENKVIIIKRGSLKLIANLSNDPIDISDKEIVYQSDKGSILHFAEAAIVK